MKLSDENAKLYFKLMLPLLVFVNIKLELFEEVSIVDDLDKLDIQEKAIIRDGLYENIQLIDDFIDENPKDLPMNELAIVSKWKNFIDADYFVERHLKKHTIFIGEDNKVFAVLGLLDTIEELIPKYALPLRIKTVLLPFQDEIVYDGFLANYNIYFGSGFKDDLKHTYMKAKRREEIIFSIDPNSPTKPKKKTTKTTKNWKPLIKDLTEKSKKLRGGAGQIELLSPTFSLVKASLELADLVTEKKIEQEDIYNCLEKLERHLNKVGKELYYHDD